MKTLLEKTRRINRTIQQSVGYQVDFNEMAKLVSEVMEATVYVFSRKGKLLGSAVHAAFGTSVMEDEVLTQGSLSADFNQELLKIDITSANQKGSDQTIYNPDVVSPFADKNITIVPLAGGESGLAL